MLLLERIEEERAVRVVCVKLQVLCSARIALEVGRNHEQTKGRNEVGNMEPRCCVRARGKVPSAS